ncbi:hypothetical protein [Streptomyces sp. NPDC088358]|uniref:hypothetical protein n=1 Tax=Streptomyces sp. NPDC088358 TaxID=3365857 RepID=UPI00380B9D79
MARYWRAGCRHRPPDSAGPAGGPATGKDLKKDSYDDIEHFADPHSGAADVLQAFLAAVSAEQQCAGRGRGEQPAGS